MRGDASSGSSYFEKRLDVRDAFVKKNGVNQQVFFARIPIREIYLAVSLIIKMNSEHNLVVKFCGFFVWYFVHILTSVSFEKRKVIYLVVLYVFFYD